MSAIAAAGKSIAQLRCCTLIHADVGIVPPPTDISALHTL
jgi:hypothetical protein